MTVLVKTQTRMGVLVVEDPEDEPTQLAVPGLLEMNIIGLCYRLFLNSLAVVFLSHRLSKLPVRRVSTLKL